LPEVDGYIEGQRETLEKSLLSRRMRKAAIIITFLPLAGYVIYAILVFSQVLQIFDVYLTIQTFGMVWCFFAIIFAFIALRYHRIGSILIIVAGVLFFVSVLLTNHYPGRHLPLSGIYTIGGILHFINAFFLERRS
jgi:Flp pilus assembly protein TadB